MKYLHFLIILYFLQPSKVEAQIVYASTFTPQTSQILKVNLGTCTTTPLVDIPAGTLDMCIAPNGLAYIVRAAIQIESVDTLSGTITLSDNFAQVTWLGLPTVSFSIAQNDICAGECRDVAVTFTGSTPFNLTYNSPLGQQTQIFGTNSGVLSICPPAGFSGPLTVEAISLTDANCTCE